MKKLLLVSVLLPFISFSQTQIGQDIDGEAELVTLGASTSLAGNGSILALGARYNNSDSGHVSIYKNEGGVWTLIGNVIDGEANDDWFGCAVSLSSDGTIVAIGAFGNDGNGSNSGHVRIYKNLGGVWTQIGTDIDGEAEFDYSGEAISLSSDGSVVAIGAYGNDGNGSNSGHVRIYKNIGGVWTQIGTDIDGEAEFDNSGSAISLSSDGSVVAIGADANDANDGYGSNSGHVRIYENIGDVWTQIGTDIDGEFNGDWLGCAVSLSSDGTIVAIGAMSNDGNGSNSGHVKIYKNIGGIWTQIGNNINGDGKNDWLGAEVSLSSDGTVVAVRGTSYLKIYKNIGGVWTQKGTHIDLKPDYFSGKLSLSSDSSIIAIMGANESDGTGFVRVYDFSAVLSIEGFKVDYFSFYPNPVNDILNIQLNAGLELKQINIYNIQSQYLFSAKTKTINTENLKSGLYFVEVETNKGKSAKKIVIE